MSASKGDLIREEDSAWAEFWVAVGSLPRDRLAEAGTYDAWSFKDVLAHVGSWHAEAAVMLEQLRMGTYRLWEADRVEALNREWWEAWEDQDPDAVLSHLHSSRARMLEEWDRLPDELLDDTAVDWFRDSGAGHYEEHLPALRELSSSGNPRKSGEADLESGQ
jgi:hypothetical protein